MKVKDLLDKLSSLNPDDELYCFADEGDKFDDAKRAYEILDIQIRKGHRERMHTKNIDATFTEYSDGVDTPLLLITSDF
ncbi:hypothetical protein [Photobacterium leiognathi]|uniref:Uncharacterized protein n=1 Tax=Photobacterium leiognathi TaxID=553611 RepID=A0A2T3M7M3_PHOLE|nr:hypothetical protein [Photobacterium leiognathi]KJF93341.1 hypothetical protein UB34_19940 [Photobacterium leiognathi]PSV88284.1 hypothetical protein CTM89_15080 [Photobacterium leiognathi]